MPSDLGWKTETAHLNRRTESPPVSLKKMLSVRASSTAFAMPPPILRFD